MGKKVLVIAAHPDDEILGCGGTVVKHVRQGDEVRSLILCEGESLRYSGQNICQYKDAQRAADIMGVSKLYWVALPDQKLDTYSLVDIISPIEKAVNAYMPQIVYVQFGGDLNRDHKIVFEAAAVALRPTLEYIEEILAFYTVGSTELNWPMTYRPDTWIDIESSLDVKIEAFSCYKTEVREAPHPRSIDGIKNLAVYTGNQCCMNSAESFVTIRRMVRGMENI